MLLGSLEPEAIFVDEDPEPELDVDEPPEVGVVIAVVAGFLERLPTEDTAVDALLRQEHFLYQRTQSSGFPEASRDRKVSLCSVVPYLVGQQ